MIKVFPQAHSSVLEEELDDMDELLMQNDSLNGACQFTKPPPSPFSSRKVMYENEEVKSFPSSLLLSSVGLMELWLIAV